MASHGQSGYYWINNTDNILKVYCDMELTSGGITGGCNWMMKCHWLATSSMAVYDDWTRLHSGMEHWIHSKYIF